MSPIFTNTFRLQNTNWRWYRDKYLTVIFVLCFLGALSLLWTWPISRGDLSRGARFLAVAAICLIASPQRMQILIGALSIVFLRGIIGSVLQRSVAVLPVCALCGVAVYWLTRRGDRLMLASPYELGDYSYAELAIDCAVLGSLLWTYVTFIR
jgi:hypothetical protein